MKVRDTSPGRLYALSSEIGCVAINGAMAADIQAGGQVVVLALDKKIVIDGDDDAKFVEVRWGTNTVVGSRPVPAWLSDVLSGLISIVGDDKFDINYMPAENKLYLQFSLGVTNEQIEEVKTLLARVLPKDLVVEMEWADGLPMSYTRLEFLESTGTQYLKLPPVDFATLELDMKFKFNELVKYHCIFSNGVVNTTRGLYILQLSDSAASLAYWDDGKGFSINPDLKALLNIKLTLEKLTINEKEINITKTSGTSHKSSFFLLSQAGFKHFPYAFLWFVNLKSATGEHKYIPALSPIGAPCMFDLVSKTPYYNEGSGDFSYPGKEAEASTFSLRRPIIYAQLTEHGVCRLYHVPKGYNGTKEEYATEYGFKPLVETPQPEEGYWISQWRETAEEIVLDWAETEPPAEEELQIEDTENA